MEKYFEVLKSIRRNIFWIDNDINNDLNQKYLKFLDDNLKDVYKSYKIKTFDSLEKFELYLKSDKDLPNFPFIYVILGENLADDYFNRYVLLQEPNIIAATIVFCKNKDYHFSMPYANDLYLNPGGVVDDFIEVIEYIQKPYFRFLKDIKENINIIPKKENDNFGNTFEYVKNLSDIVLPIILTEIIKKNLIEDNDIKKFENFIFFKYLNSQNNQRIIPFTKPSLEKEIYIPFKKRAKFLLRLYTYETEFYKDMNRELTMRTDFGPYKAYILILYFLIQNKSLKSYIDDKLYRKGFLSKKEMDNIINIFELKKNNSQEKNEISSVIYYSKPFLSFTKDISKISDKKIKPGKVKVKFILNPPKYKDKIFFSNIDMQDITSIKEEEEVLFLPFSCFEIESYKKMGEFEYEITLNYLDKYYDQIKEKISSMKDENEVKIFYQKTLGSPFSKEVIECLNNYDITYNNILNTSFFKKIIDLATRLGFVISSYYLTSSIGLAFGIVTIPGTILIGLGVGIISGLIEGLLFNPSKMKLYCASFYKNYIPLKFMRGEKIPEFFWYGVNKKAKSFVIEAIIDNKYTGWLVINIPSQTKIISQNVGETLIKYENFQKYNPTTIEYKLYSLIKEKITKEEWNSRSKYKDLIIDAAILEINVI